MSKEKPTRTAGEAGWHVSRYNLMAPVPDTKYVAIANLYKGNCAEYTPIEMYLLSVLEELDENHPIIERFAKRGVICNFDERAALETMGRASCAGTYAVGLTICPTMGCNFDCPYCFEDHGRGKMSPEVQDDIVALAKRMLDAAGAKKLSVTWFGGEPLLAPDVIESLSQRLMELVDSKEAEGSASPAGSANSANPEDPETLEETNFRASIITNGYLLTQENIDMLTRCKVNDAQITIDGLGPTHDATRHLAGGGPTFDRIVANLRDNKIPFPVHVRHNVYEDNYGEVDGLKAFIENLAEESGNDLRYYPAPVAGSAVADERGQQVGLLCEADASEIGIQQEAGRFRAGRGHYCGAHSLWSIGIDDQGNLQKCWEAVDKPQLAYGTAHDWDPLKPFETASNPDNLTMYLNTASPVPDAECRECIWLPACVGGCPYRRLFDERTCIPFRADPEAYVLALHARIGEDKNGEGESAESKSADA